MAKPLQILDRIDSLLSWWERLAKTEWIRWGVSVVTLCLFHFWAIFEKQPLIIHVTVILGAAASVTILFTFLPSLFRKLISRWLKPRFAQRGWVQIANLTNADLQREALETVHQIRDLLEQYRRDEHLQNDVPVFPQGASQEAKRLLWHQHGQEGIQLSTNLMNNYKRQFQVDAILLRDEMKKRIPHVEEDPAQHHMDILLRHVGILYENPTNPSGVDAVARDLERLAKSLPVFS